MRTTLHDSLHRLTHNRLTHDDQGEARFRLLAGVVAVMVAAGVVSLVLVLTSDGNGSGTKAAAAPAESQVGRATSSAPASSPAASSPAASSTVASPSVAPSTSKASSTSAAPTPATSSKAATSKAAAPKAAPKTLTYTVKRGDNLTAIAAWFHLHGYSPLYAWNKTLIGSNPNLIFPGQKITVSDGSMSVSQG